jgi:hypothetical protein
LGQPGQAFDDWKRTAKRFVTGPFPPALLQLLLVASLVVDPLSLLGEPIRSGDYSAHFYSASHADTHFRRTGAFWGYDPFWMAGYPEGLVGLLDNKLFCVLLLAVPNSWKALLFNVGILSTLLAVPWWLYVAAGAAGSERSERRCAAVAAIVVTFSVPVAVYFWSWGGISFFLVSSLAVPVTLTLALSLSEGSIFSQRGAAAAFAATLVVFIHPEATLVIAIGLLPVLWSSSRPPWKRFRDLAVLAGVLALAILPILQALVWLRGPFRVVDPAAHQNFQSGLPQLRRDWWIHLLDTTSLHNGAGGLLAILPLALWGFIARRDSCRAVTEHVVVAEIVGCAAVTYVLPSVLEASTILQPYRFLLPLSFFACIPAGRGIARGARLLAGGRPIAWALALVVAFIVINGAWGLSSILALGHGRDDAEVALTRFLDRSTNEEDRILVEVNLAPLWVEGHVPRAIVIHRFALLPLAVHRELIGYVGVSSFAVHRYARFQPGWLLGKRLAELSEPAVGAMLRRYAISWVVGCSGWTLSELRRFSSVLEETQHIGVCRAFRVREPERSRLLEGSGRVQADLDRLEVSEANGERLVLKYHWIPNLRTDPPLPIADAPEPGAPVGFIAVWPQGVKTFTIRLGGLLEAGSH